MCNDSFYNKLELIPPPQLSFRLCCKSPEAVGKKLNSVLGRAISILRDQNILHKESATLSRLIYRWKWRMRNDKGFKALEKVNRSLLQYLALDLESILEKAQEKICDDYGPSKQVVEWVLVRLQGFSKLFDNIYNRCMEAATYLQWRFQTGHVWGVALMGTAVISRIWIISHYLVQESSEWYCQLKQILPVLQPSIQPWLPADYVLPDDLVAWLGYPEYLLKNTDMDKTVFKFLNENDDTQFEGSEIPISNTQPLDFFTSSINKKLTDTCKEDIGESISRTDSNNSNEIIKLNKKSRVEKKNGSTTQRASNNMRPSRIDNIKTRTDLIRFVKEEKAVRKCITSHLERNNNDSKIFLTKNLDKLQWRMFQKYIKDKIQEIDNNHAKKKYILDTVKNEIKVWLS